MILRDVVLLPYGYTIRLVEGEDGYIVASCVQLPGCYAQGRSMREALAAIEDAVIGYLSLLDEEEGQIPLASANSTESYEIYKPRFDSTGDLVAAWGLARAV